MILGTLLAQITEMPANNIFSDGNSHHCLAITQNITAKIRESVNRGFPGIRLAGIRSLFGEVS